MPPKRYSFLKRPLERSILLQEKFWIDPVRTDTSVAQRFIGVVVLGVQAAAEPSGAVPSIMFSIDPEVSMSRSTFGSGGVMSIWACAAEAIDSAAPAVAAGRRR